MTSFNERVTTFLLIRHGFLEFVCFFLAVRLPIVSLDATGRNQAHQLVDRLANKQITTIYSSPLERAVQTAEPLAARLGHNIQLRERLIEIDFGEWQGKTLIELQEDARWKEFNTHRSYTSAPSGEQMLQIQTRMAKELEHLKDAHPNETVAVFSHGDVIRAALMLYLAMPLDLHHRLEISPASVSVLELADWGPRVLTVNA